MKKGKSKNERALFAAGCFWGVEYYLGKIPGVVKTTVGYSGGTTESPTYEQVCAGGTGHAETIEVTYDPAEVTYETLAKAFFEIHDPTQVNRQGPDIGHQYRSAVFYLNEEQRKIAEKLVRILEGKGLKVATTVEKAGKFWPAELYHQDYYQKNGGVPYCHRYVKRF